MASNSFERFEKIAQRLVEGSLGRLFGGRLDPLEISAEIAREIEDNQKGGFAPTDYKVQLNPTDFSYLRVKWPDIAPTLKQYIHQIAGQLRLEFASEPTVELVASPDVGRHVANITATHRTLIDETTQMYKPLRQYNPLDALQKLDAFLIINGKRHVSLAKAAITVGRRSDCDIVVDQKTVSRRHAQIRWKFGRFVIYDLGSRGGTFVNEQPIDEFVLRQGDVIRLADEVTLIYGEGFANTRPQKPTTTTGQETRMMPRVEKPKES